MARKTAAEKAAEAAAQDTTEWNDTAAPAGKKETVQQLKNRLRNEAEREVLNRHKDEVVTITQAKYDEHGLKYVRRLSDEEKAAKVIEDLYEKFPQLRPTPETKVEAAAPEPYAPGFQAYDTGM